MLETGKRTEKRRGKMCERGKRGVWDHVSYGTVLISSFISAEEQRNVKPVDGYSTSSLLSPSPYDSKRKEGQNKTNSASSPSSNVCEIVVYSTDCYVLAYRLIYTRAAGLERLLVVVFFRPAWPLS